MESCCANTITCCTTTEVIRCDRDGTYWKVPPVSVDPEQTPVLMPLKTRNLRDLGLLVAV